MQPATNLLVAFGSNEAGPWGQPEAAIRRAIAELEAEGISLLRVSRLATTAPVGPEPQPNYCNAAAFGRTSLDAERMLCLAKRLETKAGRRPGPRWGPRPLDIDILDFGGTVAGWAQPHDPMHPAHLVLPHPELHKRAFVLQPLIEVAADWRHPVLGLTPAEMLARLDG